MPAIVMGGRFLHTASGRFASHCLPAQEAGEEDAAERGEERLQIPLGELGRTTEEERGRGEELTERLLLGPARAFIRRSIEVRSR